MLWCHFTFEHVAESHRRLKDRDSSAVIVSQRLTSVVFAATLWFSAAAVAEQSGDHELVLFALDDHAIPWRDNLHLTLEHAKKHPSNPVLRRGPRGAPDHGHAILYGTVVRQNGKFRMWYLGMPDRSLDTWRKTRWRPMCYAESEDGVSWDKPPLDLVNVNGSRKNNTCLIQSDDEHLSRIDDFLCVMHDADDSDPARRYKCAYIAHPPWEEIKGGLRDVGQRPGRPAVMVTAVSADGLRWRVVGDRPAVDEKFEVSGLYRFGNFYYATGQQISPWSWRADGTEIGRTMVVYRSADFRHWSKAKAVAFSRPGQRTRTAVPGQQTHMGAGLWNRGNVLVGLYGIWQDGPSKKPPGAARLWGTHIDLGLVVSNDGIHFREPVPGHKVIARGGAGQWDETALLQGHAFANVRDRTLIWYSHWDTTGQLKNMDIGLATLRRDGFGYLSLHKAHSPGHCVTQPIASTDAANKLFVNVSDVSPEKPMTVELLDDSDRPLPDYSGDNAAVIDADSVRHPVLWPASGSGQLPTERDFAIRLNFPQGGTAKLYCCYVTTAHALP